jgi:hypothetical protein
MRIALFVVSSLFAAACIPQDPDAGSEGYECRLGFNYWDGGACDDDLTCVDGTCISCDDPEAAGLDACHEPDPAEPDPCLGGSTKHLLYVIDGGCGATELIFYTNTPEEAEACRDQYVAAAFANEEVCDLDEVPELTTVCQLGGFGSSTMQLWNCSANQLQSCETYWCPDCTYTPGDCP